MTNETDQVEMLDHAARLQQVVDAFVAHGAPGASGTTTYLFALSGQESGNYLLTLSPEGAKWEAGYEGDADVSIRLSTDDFLAIADGKLDGRLAIAGERIEISGDLAAAAAMISQLSPPEDLD